ncbi:hypothetical protein [Haladaptatus salinisoli]|uniref:hypothetical protein n=1 Tax=Haladaptatus salinisoli TaxID=2884876 RepID=UPI001D0AF054|nr:hypothetical protein [Haladaptatus salinisoli]
MSVRLQTRTAISREEAHAATLAALAGAILVGILLQVTNSNVGVTEFGRLVGASYSTGWIVLLVASAGFALAFVEFLSRTVNSFVTRVITMSSQQEHLRKLLVPLLRRSALTLTAANLGLAYGLALAVVFHALLLPVWLRYVANVPVPVPNVDVGLLVWVLYGGVLGVVYGQMMEK